MSKAAGTGTKLGWIGTGRMGYEMAARLGRAGCNVLAWNRTRAKAQPLGGYGVQVADRLGELAGCEIVFTMVSTSDDLGEVLSGPGGLLGTPGVQPRIVVDCSSISIEASAQARASLAAKGIAFLAAPVSGNAKVIKAGKLSVVSFVLMILLPQCAPFLPIFAPAAATA